MDLASWPCFFVGAVIGPIGCLSFFVGVIVGLTAGLAIGRTVLTGANVAVSFFKLFLW